MSDDPSSYSEFVAARERALLGFAVLLTANRHAAEDLVQASLTQLYLHWSRVRREDAEAYVRRTMVNINISWWRRHRGRERLVAEPTDGPAPGDPMAAADQRDELRRALARLPRRQRSVVVPRYYAGLSEAETAAAMGCGIGTVKSQSARGVAALRVLFDRRDVVGARDDRSR